MPTNLLGPSELIIAIAAVIGLVYTVLQSLTKVRSDSLARVDWTRRLMQLSPDINSAFGLIVARGTKFHKRMMGGFLVVVFGVLVVSSVLNGLHYFSPTLAILVAFFVIGGPLFFVRPLTTRVLERMQTNRTVEPKDWEAASTLWVIVDETVDAVVALAMILIAFAFLSGGFSLFLNIRVDVQLGFNLIYGYVIVRDRLNAGMRVYFQVYQTQFVSAEKEVEVWLDVSHGPRAGTVIGKIASIGDRLRVVREDTYVEEIDWSIIERLAVRPPDPLNVGATSMATR